MRADRVAAVGAAALLLVGLVGCSGTASEPQELTATYTIDGDTRTADVAVPGLLCRTAVGQMMFTTTAERPADGPALFSATADEATGESKVVSVRITDDLWFLSAEPFTATADGLSFDALTGTVAPLGDNGIISTDVVDDAATITGDLDCTEKK